MTIRLVDASDNLPGKRPLAAVGQDEFVQDLSGRLTAHDAGDEQALICLQTNPGRQPGGFGGGWRSALALGLFHGDISVRVDW